MQLNAIDGIDVRRSWSKRVRSCINFHMQIQDFLYGGFMVEFNQDMVVFQNGAIPKPWVSIEQLPNANGDIM